VYMQFIAREKYAAQSRRPIPVCAARIPDTTAEERMDERILARAALAKIGEVLAELSQIDQAIVELTAVAGMSSSVIGSELGLSQTAVTTRLSRARARLKDALGPELMKELGIAGRRGPGGGR
jgi:RNA polymerase sigma factor (sigma-70 family)